jgi:predicted permease
MRFMRRLFKRLISTATGRRNDERLKEEIEEHLALQTAEYIHAGLSPAEARRQAVLKFGAVEAIKEDYRAQRGMLFVETLVRDCAYAFRMLRKNPGFTAVAIVTLALGIGANTAIFSLIDSLLLRSLPVSNPQELVFLQWSAHNRPNYHSSYGYGDCQMGPGHTTTGCNFSHPFFNELLSQAGMFSGITASGGAIGLDLSGNGPASTMQGFIVSGNYFDTLGVRPVAGRMIEPSDDNPSASAVAVLSYGYWQKSFGGSLSVIGKTIGLNGIPTTIVGVAEQRFVGLTPGSAPDAWLPLSLRPLVDPQWSPTDDDAGSVWLVIIARLRPQVPRQQAESAVSLLFRNEMLYGAKRFSQEADEPAVSLIPAQTGLVGARGTYSTPLFILMAVVGIVLLIAAANVAGLLLARSTGRQKEMAVRLALGAGRGRVARQLLTESVLLSVFGAVLGILLAFWGARAIVAFVAKSSTQPPGFAASIDTRVLLFTTAIAILTGVVFGLAPAMRGTRVDLTPTLKGGAGASVGRSGGHWLNGGNLLVAGQIALTMIVLVGAGLAVRTLRNLRDVDAGFDTSNMLNFRINPALAGYKGAQVDALYHNLLRRLGGIPSVTSVTYSSVPLLVGWQQGTTFHLASAAEKSVIDSDFLRVGPDFFATLKMSLLAGRDFSPSDFIAASTAAAVPSPTSSTAVTSAPQQPPSPRAAIVNETYVRRYLGNAHPLGQRFRHPKADPSDPGYVVVGVVRDARYTNLRGAILPTTYAPAGGGGGVVFELRTAKSPSSIVPAVRSVVNQVDSNLPISNVMTESESIDQLLFQERLIARLSSFFGGLALLLACIGLYGLLSYEVTQRTREIGIRMAVGAGRSDILRNVVGQGLALAFIGLVVGAIASLGVTRFIRNSLYDVRAGDPITMVAVTAILVLVALVASWIPASRATRVDPMVALRHD